MRISLRAARVNAGYTQKDLAKQLNRSESTIINWEKGYSKMDVEDFKNLCKVLNISEDNIFLPHESS